MPTNQGPETHRREGPLADYQEPPAQVNTSEVPQTESGVALTPEQLAIWIEMQFVNV